MPAGKGDLAARGSEHLRSALGSEVLAAVEFSRAARDRAHAVAEGGGLDQGLQREAEAARRGRAADAAGRLGTEELLELAFRVPGRSYGGTAEVNLGCCLGRNLRLGSRRCRIAGSSALVRRRHDGAGGGDRDGQQEARGGQRHTGLLAHATGGGKVCDLTEGTAAPARFALRIAGSLDGDGYGRARLRSGARRAATAPGILHGQELFLSG
jgi:hypothetical protein